MVNRIFAKHLPEPDWLPILEISGVRLNHHHTPTPRLARSEIHPQWLEHQSHASLDDEFENLQRSSRVTAKHHQIDATNRFLARIPLQRLDAEALRDSLLFVSGRMSLKSGGIPDAVSVGRNGMVSVYPSEENNHAATHADNGNASIQTASGKSDSQEAATVAKSKSMPAGGEAFIFSTVAPKSRP